jgi:hypothetical protein
MRTRPHRPLSILAATAALLALAGTITGPASAAAAGQPAPLPGRPAETRNPAAARVPPLAFQPNNGQAAPTVRYLAQAPGLTVLLTTTAVTLNRSHARHPLTLEFRHANPHPRITPNGRQPGTVNYFLGGSPARWHTHIPLFTQVTYHQLWPGIDATITAAGGALRYAFHLAPGASPAEIQLAYTPARHLTVSRSGTLAATTPAGPLAGPAPTSTQAIRGHTAALPAGYRLLPGGGFGFTLARQPARAAVTIGPGLAYGTFLGGSVADSAFSIDTDTAGDTYVFGQTASPNFPTTPGAYQRRMTAKTGGVFFVTKIAPGGRRLIYSTFVGGTSFQGLASGITATDGDAYVTGETGSADFPVTPGAYRRTPFLGDTQAVVFKLNPTGTRLIYSTYLAPDLISSGLGRQIGLAPGGSVIVTGNTSADYAPTTPHAYQRAYPGGLDAGYVARLNPTGSALIYATYLGAPVTRQIQATGAFPDCETEGLAVGTHGAAYLTSQCPPGFPTTPGAYQATAPHGGGLLVKLAPGGQQADYATYWGNNQRITPPGTPPIYAPIRPDAVTVDAHGDAALTADAPNGSVRATPGAWAAHCTPAHPTPSNPHPYCTAAAEFSPAGTGLVYASYFGGSTASSAYDSPDGIVTAAGNTYITGTGTARDIPVTPGAYQHTPGDYTNPFYLAILSKTGRLVYASYFGGTGGKCISSLGCGAVAGNITIAPPAAPRLIYLGGTTTAANFPVTAGAFQTAYPGGINAVWAASLHLPSLTPHH